jgi:hypothetical protein
MSMEPNNDGADYELERQVLSGETNLGELVAFVCPYCGHMVEAGLMNNGSMDRLIHWNTADKMWTTMVLHLKDRHTPTGHSRY